MAGETTENTEGTEDTEKSKENRVPREGQRDPELVHEELTGRIRQTAFEVHRYFGHGFLEKVYERSLANRLRKQGIDLATQVAMTVRDEDGAVVGEYVAVMLVAGSVIVEIKVVTEILREHQAQVISYLNATGMRVGLLINFGQPRLQVRRFTL